MYTIPVHQNLVLHLYSTIVGVDKTASTKDIKKVHIDLCTEIPLHQNIVVHLYSTILGVDKSSSTKDIKKVHNDLCIH